MYLLFNKTLRDEVLKMLKKFMKRPKKETINLPSFVTASEPKGTVRNEEIEFDKL